MPASILTGYYTIVIPFSEQPTEWHPTAPTGPFSVLTRGAFETAAEARQWAHERLGGQPFGVRFIEPLEPSAYDPESDLREP